MKTKVHARSRYIGHSSINGERRYEALCGMWVPEHRFGDTEPNIPVTCKKCLHKLQLRAAMTEDVTFPPKTQ